MTDSRANPMLNSSPFQFQFKVMASAVCTLVLMSGCANLTSWMTIQRIPVHQEFSEKQKEEIDVRFGMTRIIERKGKLAEAKKSYHEILQIDPSYHPAFHRLGVMAASEEDLELALEYLGSAVELEPTSAELLGDIGYVYLLQSDLANAQQHLAQAFELAPDDARITNNLALVVGYQGNLNEALTLFRRCNPESQALANVGYLLSQRGEFEQAQQYFHQSLNIDPSVQQAANGLIEVDKVLQQNAVSSPSNQELRVSVSPGKTR